MSAPLRSKADSRLWAQRAGALDLPYVSRDRARFLTTMNVQGQPDLVVEVLSPRTRRRDRGIKRNLYERAGVAEHWILGPAADCLTVYRRGDSGFAAPVLLSKRRGDVLTGPLLPGLSIELSTVLA